MQEAGPAQRVIHRVVGVRTHQVAGEVLLLLEEAGILRLEEAGILLLEEAGILLLEAVDAGKKKINLVRRNDRNGPIGAAAKCSRNAQDRMDPLRSSGAPRAAVPERVRWFQICYIVSICYSHPLVFQSNHLFQSDHTAT